MPAPGDTEKPAAPAAQGQTAAKLLVRCLENESVEYIFGVPGEENIDVMDALLESPIKFVTTHHEQGAAFMADVYGRLTGRAGVCMSTLGPGRHQPHHRRGRTANMDRAPGRFDRGPGRDDAPAQGEPPDPRPRAAVPADHQVLDADPRAADRARDRAQGIQGSRRPKNPAPPFIDFPENIAEMKVEGDPIEVQTAYTSATPDFKIDQAAQIIANARNPIILAGNGVIRQGAADSLVSFAEMLRIPVANTFMAKGVVPFSNPLSLGTIGLKARDLPWFAFEKADVVICVGYDMVEYHPDMWNPNKDKQIVHIDALPAEVDAHYRVAVGALGEIGSTLRGIAVKAKPQRAVPFQAVRKALVEDRAEFANDSGFPVKPQKIVHDVREVLGPDDIAISDVGAHKMWMSRMYRAERPNTCIISNGFAAMGIAVPGAIAAKLAYPDRKVIAVTGDAGFMMNSQEIETGLRMKTPFVILIWNDSEYGLITWHQLRHFGRPSHISFKNPDFVKYAESFGAKGYRVESAKDLVPTLKKAFADNTVVIVDCPVDYSENMKLTQRLKELKSPLD
jgi:acetolactate synthase-1/2/3 large subunit